MSKKFVKLAPTAMFKMRYGKWYLIETQHQRKSRFRVGEETEKVLLSLFRGEEVSLVSSMFGFSDCELENFLSDLIDGGTVQWCNQPEDSTDRCFEIDPPLDGVNVLLTNSCNLRCLHCYVSSGKKAPGELNGEEWIRVLGEAQKLGAFEINISGGEAMLHSDFEQVALFIASMRTFNVNLNTNGVILDPRLEEIIPKAFSSVQVSIDNPNPEKHDKFRGRDGSFRRSISFIQRLVQKGVETNISFTLTPESIGFVDEMIRLGEELGISILNIGLVANFGRASENSIANQINSRGDQNSGFLERVYLEVKRLKKINSTVEILLPFRIPDRSESLEPKKKEFICGGDHTQLLYIMADGSLMPCDKLPINEFACGNVRSSSLSEIWKSEKMKKFKLMNPVRLPKCKSCPQLSICGGACVARAFHDGGSLESPDWTSCFIARRFSEDIPV